MQIQFFGSIEPIRFNPIKKHREYVMTNKKQNLETIIEFVKSADKRLATAGDLAVDCGDNKGAAQIQETRKKVQELEKHMSEKGG